ncbi:hydroxyethylthiazole kinase [Pseudomonas sp. 478]|uniref:M23 family metallopeptidase n=1 Tax=unclassified Pseudomonas TaxID=196821 RepID=UPI000DABA1AD|nr:MULTISPECIES: M23 family metallopeptidase [unclassified Pseudomonas]PZX01902.1 hydroxyethylthiazole kinase [Pseudomonas sp. 478]TCV52166.1 hydroxyethylthiazole kinase [Pseudomonas sp. 460]
MLISPPFLPAPTAGESDEAYLSRAMLCGKPGDGFFPISFDLNWHGGTHLKAPTEAGHVLPVRAIADGTLAYFREAAPVDTSPDAPLNYGGWTDNGCVVLRHETEIGEGSSSKVVFYSIYMHLSKITVKDLKKGMQIYRKETLGNAGKIYGADHKIHFEIISDDSQVKKLIGRTERELEYQTASGRKDSCWGDMYFYLPPEIIGYTDHPASWVDSNNASSRAVRPTEDLFVRMSYGQGQCNLSTYTLEGECIGEQEESKDFEFELYEEAIKRYPRCASAGYELLRFGRVLGPDALAPANAAHWRKIALPDGPAWFDLNGSTVTCFSDADFPHWQGWKLIDDDTDEDSHCQSPYLRSLLKLDEDPLFPPSRSFLEISKKPDLKYAPVKPEEEHVYSKAYRIKQHNKDILETDSSQKKLNRCIFKFPSEWGKNDFNTRYGWLQQESELGPAMPKGDYEELKAHQESMAFWEDAGLADIGAKHWHFPPKDFIETFRKCSWLSTEELTQCIPRSFIGEDHKSKILYRASIPYSRASDRAASIKVSLNKVMRKYLIVTKQRMSQFVANGLVESGFFSQFAELGRGKDKKYKDWYGRGIIQITHEENYVKYFKHRGRGVTNAAQNIAWRDKVETEAYDQAESAGFWWAKNRANKTSDPSAANITWQVDVCEDYNWKTHQCNASLKSENRLSNPTLDLVGRHVNTGKPTTTIRMNGLPERRDTFTNVQAVLSDLLYTSPQAGELPGPTPSFIKRQKQ